MLYINNIENYNTKHSKNVIIFINTYIYILYIPIFVHNKHTIYYINI